MSDLTPPASSLSNNVRRPRKGAKRTTSFKRRSAPPGSLSKVAAPEPVDSGSGTTVNEEEDMAASFLQYCAMCEKQITTPSNSILYCSEACRRKDSHKPLALAAAAMVSPTTTPPSSAPSSPRPILPARIPTGTRPASTPALRIPADLHNAKSDLDPTEWKPKIRQRDESEAFRYLSQFHRSTSSMTVIGNSSSSDLHDEHHSSRIPQRPLYSHRSNTSINSMTTPSLAQTPTTAASSLSTSAGGPSASYGYDYDFNTRPLQLRHNPLFSASASTTKGIDLVMPHVAPPAPATAAATAPAKHTTVSLSSAPRQVDRKYEKVMVPKSPSTFTDKGLGALLGASK